MVFDEATWRFPTEALDDGVAVLCVHREARSGELYCEGGRIDFGPIPMPDVNWGYRKTSVDELSLVFALPRFGFTDLKALEGWSVSMSESERLENYGSIYVFGAHNPVDTIRADFGALRAGRLGLTLLLRFDFEFEDRIGGVFDHQLELEVTVEKRYKLDER